MFGLGPDEGDPVLFDDVGEARVFAEEPVARVDRVGTRDFGGGDDRGDIQIAVRSGRRSDADRLVGEAHVHRIGVSGRVHRDSLDPHFMRRAVDAQRDLATVGDQQFFDRGHQSITTRGWSYSTGWPLSTRTAEILPALVAAIGFITFIASMMSKVCPSFTVSPTLMNGFAPGSGKR